MKSNMVVQAKTSGWGITTIELILWGGKEVVEAFNLLEKHEIACNIVKIKWKYFMNLPLLIKEYWLAMAC